MAFQKTGSATVMSSSKSRVQPSVTRAFKRGCGADYMEMPVTSEDFRALALSLPNVRAATSLGNEEFRVSGATFATLGSPDVTRAVIKLSPRDQAEFVALAPNAFSAASGGPGVRGSTRVRLAAVEAPIMRRALEAACRKALAGSRPGSRSTRVSPVRG